MLFIITYIWIFQLQLLFEGLNTLITSPNKSVFFAIYMHINVYIYKFTNYAQHFVLFKLIDINILSFEFTMYMFF